MGIEAMKLGFMFAGQGAQTVGMGRELYACSPAAKAVFDQADTILGRRISDLCFTGPQAALTASANCQPAIYTMSVACLAALGERCSPVPIVCGGLSLGEFAAAHAAGVFCFAAGLRLVARRGELMGEACAATDGAMAAVLNAEAALVEEVCRANDIDVANYNCPGQIVISGEASRVAVAVASLTEKGARAIMLPVDGAFHSRLMASAATAFAPFLAAVEFHAPRYLLAQNYVGGMVAEPRAIGANLAAQITGAVRWQACLAGMLEAGVEALVEFGPGKVLNGFMKRVDRRFPVYNVSNDVDLASTVEALGKKES